GSSCGNEDVFYFRFKPDEKHHQWNQYKRNFGFIQQQRYQRHVQQNRLRKIPCKMVKEIDQANHCKRKYSTTFITEGTAHRIRRSVFQELGESNRDLGDQEYECKIPQYGYIFFYEFF